MTKIPDTVIDNYLKQEKANIEETSISLQDIEDLGSKDVIKEMYGDIKKYRQMLQEKITFINDDLSKVIPFTRENLYLICAFTGSGKSTIAANISLPLYKQQKKTLIISNEEPKQDVLMRIACIELGLNFNGYKKGYMQPTDIAAAMKLFPAISRYVKVIDVNYKDGFTTKVECVKAALEQVQQSEEFSCAMIDYFQLIKHSLKNPQASTYEVLNDFRMWMGRYIKASRVPIVLLAQLHSITKRGKDIDGRIKHCPEVSETASVILEVQPDFEKKMSSIVVVKDRFGYQGKKLEMGYDNGKFVPYTQEFQQKVEQDQLAILANTIQDKDDEDDEDDD